MRDYPDKGGKFEDMKLCSGWQGCYK